MASKNFVNSGSAVCSAYAYAQKTLHCSCHRTQAGLLRLDYIPKTRKKQKNGLNASLVPLALYYGNCYGLSHSVECRFRFQIVLNVTSHLSESRDNKFIVIALPWLMVVQPKMNLW